MTLLSLIPQYRRLEHQIASLTSDLTVLRESHAELEREKLRLQDQLEAAREDKSELWKMTHEAINAERASYQMHVNRAWVEHGFGPPYPEAPAPPPRPPVPAPTPRPMFPSERAARETLKFIKDHYNA